MTDKVLAAIKGNEFMENAIKTTSALQRFGDPSEVFSECRYARGLITELFQ